MMPYCNHILDIALVKNFSISGGGIRIAANGMIVHAEILPARPNDIKLTDNLLAGTPAGTTILADKAFLSKEMQTNLKERHGLLLLTPLKKRMKISDFILPQIAKPIRQLIETVNGQLVDRFKIQKMRVRKGWTLLAKWYRKISLNYLCLSEPSIRT